MTDEDHGGCLIIGIGNVLMGDEGVGVHAIRHLETMALPEGVECLDGGTGGMHLLEFLQRPQRIILIDATADGAAPGTIRRLRPRFARDYPRSLTAHDIGLKDVLDALYLLGTVPEVTLFTVSIRAPGDLDTELSPPVAAQVPVLAARVRDEADT